MNTIIVAVIIFFQIVTGFVLCQGFFSLRKRSIFETLPFAFGMGVGFYTYLLLILSQLHIEWNPLYILPLFLIATIYFLFGKKEEFEMRFSFYNKMTYFQKTMLAGIYVTVFYTLFQALLRPLYAWDGWAIWLVKSKAFYLDGFINPVIFHVLHDSYPFIMSLNSTLYYLFIGSADDKAVLVSYFGFYVMSGILLFSSFYKKIGIYMGLLSVFLFYTLQNEIRHGGRFEAGYSDLALGFYFFASLVIFRFFREKKLNSSIILLGIFLGMTSLIKQEGLAMAAIVAIQFIFYSLKARISIRKMILLFIGFVPFVNWYVFKLVNSINGSLYENSSFHMSRFFEIMYFMAKEFLNIQNWNLFWVVVVFCVPIIVKNRLIRYELFAAAALFFVYIGVFMVSPHDPSVHIPNVMNRLLLHVALIWFYILFTSVYELLNKKPIITLKFFTEHDEK